MHLASIACGRWWVLVVGLVLASCSVPAPGSTASTGGGAGQTGDSGGQETGSGGSGGILDASSEKKCTSPDAAASCTPSRSNVSFSADVAPILHGCAGEICHNTQWGGSNPYPTMMNVVAYECCDGRLIVKPGDPNHSYLWQKVADRDLCAGAPMPLGATPLTTSQVQTIYDWICLGAKNN